MNEIKSNILHPILPLFFVSFLLNLFYFFSLTGIMHHGIHSMPLSIHSVYIINGAIFRVLSYILL